MAALISIAIPGMLAQQLGVDIDINAGLVNVSTWECIAEGGVEFASIQAWDCNDFNENLIANVKNALAGGITVVDIYLFISSQCNYDSASIIAQVQQAFPGQQPKRTFWFDIEQCTGCWTDISDNMAYMTTATQEATSLGIEWGIFSSSTEWSQVMGNQDWKTGGYLWYTDLDGQENYNDGGYSFGGFTSASRKQYAGNVNLCNINVNLDWDEY